MRPRARWLAALALLLASQPARAAPANGSSRIYGGRGITLSGFAGAGYLLVSDPKGSQSRFDWAAGLNVSGGLVDPGWLRWSLSGTYLGGQAFGHLGRSWENGFSFGGSVTAFSRTPIALVVSAQRNFTSAATGSGTSMLTGSNGVTVLNAEAYFRKAGLPFASLGLMRTMVDTTQHSGATSFSGRTRLLASISQNLAALDYGVNYEGTWEDGTYGAQNFGSHAVSGRLTAALSNTLGFNLSDSYFHRRPSTDLPGSSRIDSNQLNTGLQWTPTSRFSGGLSYGHHLASFAAAGQPPVENVGHSVGQSLGYELFRGLWLSESLAVRYARATVSGASRSGWGQDLTLSASWQRTFDRLSLSAGVNGSAGLVEPDTGGLSFSYGVGGDVRASLTFGRASGQLSYTVGYSSGGPAIFGYTFRQVAQVGARFRPASVFNIAASFNASSARREDAFQGTFLNRSLGATLSAGFRQHNLNISAGLTDGVDAALMNPGWGGGLFLPTGYNTQTRYVQAYLSTSLDRGRLGIRLGGRAGDSSAPNRPREIGAGATGAVWYEIGRFRFTLEDTLNYNDHGGIASWNNVVMFRVTRDFLFGLFSG